MQVILKQDFDQLGLEGDTLEVAAGYARNFLIPKGIALQATPQNIKIFEQRRKKIEIRRLRAKEEAESIKERIEAMEIAFSQKAGEEGKLYGSVTAMDIAGQFEKQGVVIDRRKIVLEKPIKSLGEHEVAVKLYPQVTAAARVVVNPEKEKQS